jgi:hypothetical protein
MGSGDGEGSSTDAEGLRPVPERLPNRACASRLQRCRRGRARTLRLTSTPRADPREARVVAPANFRFSTASLVMASARHPEAMRALVM